MKDLKFAVICIICMVKFILFSHHYSVTDIHLILESFINVIELRLTTFSDFFMTILEAQYDKNVGERDYYSIVYELLSRTFIILVCRMNLMKFPCQIFLSIDSTTHVLQRKKCATSTDNCVKQQSITRFSSFYNLSSD